MTVMGSVREMMLLLDFEVGARPWLPLGQGRGSQPSTWRDERAVVSGRLALSETASGNLGS